MNAQRQVESDVPALDPDIKDHIPQKMTVLWNSADFTPLLTNANAMRVVSLPYSRLISLVRFKELFDEFYDALLAVTIVTHARDVDDALLHIIDADRLLFLLECAEAPSDSASSTASELEHTAATLLSLACFVARWSLPDASLNPFFTVVMDAVYKHSEAQISVRRLSRFLIALLDRFRPALLSSLIGSTLPERPINEQERMIRAMSQADSTLASVFKSTDILITSESESLWEVAGGMKRCCPPVVITGHQLLAKFNWCISQRPTRLSKAVVSAVLSHISKSDFVSDSITRSPRLYAKLVVSLQNATASDLHGRLQTVLFCLEAFWPALSDESEVISTLSSLADSNNLSPAESLDIYDFMLKCSSNFITWGSLSRTLGSCLARRAQLVSERTGLASSAALARHPLTREIGAIDDSLQRLTRECVDLSTAPPAAVRVVLEAGLSYPDVPSLLTAVEPFIGRLEGDPVWSTLTMENLLKTRPTFVLSVYPYVKRRLAQYLESAEGGFSQNAAVLLTLIAHHTDVGLVRQAAMLCLKAHFLGQDHAVHLLQAKLIDQGHVTTGSPSELMAALGDGHRLNVPVQFLAGDTAVDIFAADPTKLVDGSTVIQFINTVVDNDGSTTALLAGLVRADDATWFTDAQPALFRRPAALEAAIRQLLSQDPPYRISRLEAESIHSRILLTISRLYRGYHISPLPSQIHMAGRLNQFILGVETSPDFPSAQSALLCIAQTLIPCARGNPFKGALTLLTAPHLRNHLAVSVLIIRNLVTRFLDDGCLNDFAATHVLRSTIAWASTVVFIRSLFMRWPSAVRAHYGVQGGLADQDLTAYVEHYTAVQPLNVGSPIVQQSLAIAEMLSGNVAVDPLLVPPVQGQDVSLDVVREFLYWGSTLGIIDAELTNFLQFVGEI
ncbi:hypothetical protein J8273_5120 [Carpediemonas membranifera]|uniref:Uncharacterized protein n=1 Tax=Carpediemonas membranifera TaxID=201153 RepID=A0A8J6E0Q5_9EUKA|nr:hypothetical protein J8273_5120 [Carpediemonas membranifera]|eukprot:KAG9392141.1 hypothetical protein J8273_5120 [Carpediemonas membranifera]